MDFFFFLGGGLGGGKTMEDYRMKSLLLLVFLGAGIVGARTADLVKGRVYLKNGTVVECTGNDRIELPKRSGRLKIWRDAFLKTKDKEWIEPEEVDSIVCWHVRTPEHPRRFVYAERPGWMWVYFATPHIQTCIYGKKGYGIDTNGGIQVWQRIRIFSRSRVAYFLRRRGEEVWQDMGGVNRRSKERFRERIAQYVEDDPELAQRVLRSSVGRAKTVLMLKDYCPIKLISNE